MRGGIIVIIGIVSVAISICIGFFMQRVALDALDGGNPRQMMDTMMKGILFFSAIASLFFYGGIFAFVVGIVLMIVQSQQPKYSNGRSSVRSEHFPDHKEPDSSRAERESALEEENRRLREELARFEQSENPS